MDSVTSQTRGPGWGTAQKMVSYSLLLHFFPTLAPLSHGLKITRINKIHITTRNSSLSEINFIPRRRNTLVHLPLDTMADSPVWFIIITNNISSNTSNYTVVPFLLVPLHWQEKFQERERKRVQTATKKVKAQRKT